MRLTVLLGGNSRQLLVLLRTSLDFQHLQLLAMRGQDIRMSSSRSHWTVVPLTLGISLLMKVKPVVRKEMNTMLSMYLFHTPILLALQGVVLEKEVLQLLCAHLSGTGRRWLVST